MDSKVDVFYADPVDEHGNVIATVKLTNANVRASWTDNVRVTKIPASEIVLDPESSTIHADLTDD